MATRDDFLALRQAADGLRERELLELVLHRFGNRIALASSFSAEDQVLLDMLAGLTDRPPVFTLDTGRLPEETYDLIDATRQRYDIAIEVLFPERADVEEFTARHGVNAFYQSVELRKACCHVRKVLPLRRKLSQLDAWITGLRREQSVTRTHLDRVEWDEGNGLIIKLSPLADWTSEQVWEYIHSHNVLHSALHGRGYPSIGCAPCTRAVEPGQDARSGRWWWEEPEHKECGLHVLDGRIARKGERP